MNVDASALVGPFRIIDASIPALAMGPFRYINVAASVGPFRIMDTGIRC
jgi:hypothetical protein